MSLDTPARPRRRPAVHRAARPAEQLSLGKQFEDFATSLPPKSSGPRNAEGTTISVSMDPDKAAAVARNGAIRNGFDPATSGVSKVISEHADRRLSERHIFDIPEDADHTQRPVYAWLRHSDTHETPFGDAVLDVHPGNRRVTTHPGDTLMNFARSKVEQIYQPGGPRPGDINEHAAYYTKRNTEELGPHHQPILRDPYDRTNKPEYREVHIHGGAIPASQISRATLYRSANFEEGIDQARDALRGAGIPTRVMTHMEYQPTLDSKMFGKGEKGWVDEEAYGAKGGAR